MTTTAQLSGFRIGDRVELSPHLDRWMMGDRFGVVVRNGRIHVHVKLDRSGSTIAFNPTNLKSI